MLRRRWWQELQNYGFEAYLVGGAPRDLLLSKRPQDWDVTTNASPDRVRGSFERTLSLGEKFGTIQVLINDYQVEVTTFRREGEYSDGRRPDRVEFTSSLLEDLSRRDFTINAIALDPLKKKLVDPFGGVRDLKRRLVRAVGDPEVRFQEDALRMLRFFRFQSTLGFRGERRTEGGIKPEILIKISAERIREELTKLLVSPFPELGLYGMARTGLLTTIIPEFIPIWPEDNALFRHLVATVKAIKPQAELRWAALLHDLGKASSKVVVGNKVHYYGHDQVGQELAAGILERLRFSGSFCQKVLTLVRWHMFTVDPMISDAALRRLVIKVGEENIKDLLEVRRADLVGTGGPYYRAQEVLSLFARRVEALLTGETVFSRKDLAINGQDVMSFLALPPGPKVGEVLQEIFYWVTEDPERNKKDLILSYLEKFR